MREKLLFFLELGIALPLSTVRTVLLLPELYLSYIELYAPQKISQDRNGLLLQLWKIFCALQSLFFVHDLGMFDDINVSLMTTRVKARERERLCSTVCPEAILQRGKYKQTERGGTKLGIDTLES